MSWAVVESIVANQWVTRLQGGVAPARYPHSHEMIAELVAATALTAAEEGRISQTRRVRNAWIHQFARVSEEQAREAFYLAMTLYAKFTGVVIHLAVSGNYMQAG